jgi:hypothetical protein
VIGLVRRWREHRDRRDALKGTVRLLDLAVDEGLEIVPPPRFSIHFDPADPYDLGILVATDHRGVTRQISPRPPDPITFADIKERVRDLFDKYPAPQPPRQS